MCLRRLGAAIALSLFAFHSSAQAQDYPVRPVTIPTTLSCTKTFSILYAP